MVAASLRKEESSPLLNMVLSFKQISLHPDQEVDTTSIYEITQSQREEAAHSKKEVKKEKAMAFETLKDECSESD